MRLRESYFAINSKQMYANFVIWIRRVRINHGNIQSLDFTVNRVLMKLF